MQFNNILKNTTLNEKLFEDAMASFIFENKPVIAVAVSGGVDSLALLNLAFKWVKEKNGEVIALTVDHNLRADSSQEAASLHLQLTKAGIRHVVLPWRYSNRPTSNIQAQARVARYDLLTKFCQENHILHLLVGHHLNDQVETLLINLQRGSGLDGLSAIPPLSYYNNVRIIRPLLNVTKSALKAFLENLSIPWFEDPSNLAQEYTRNKIRALLETALINNELIETRLGQTTHSLARARVCLEKHSAEIMADCVNISPLGYAELKIDSFLATEEEEALRVLANILLTISGKSQPLRLRSLQTLYRKLVKPTATILTLSGCKINTTRVAKSNKVIIYREIPKDYAPLIVAKGGTWLWDQRFSVTIKTLPAVKGDRYIVNYLGVKGLKVIENYIKIPAIPKEILFTLPAISVNDMIIALPQLGFYLEEDLSNEIQVRFKPSVPLGKNFFGYITR
jgi:tRNA(Ile)-lysidine synthase